MKIISMCVLILAVTFDTYAAGKPAGNSRWNDIPVTQYIADEGLNLVPYSVQSDGLDAYQNGNGDESVLMENGFNGIPYADRKLFLTRARTIKVSLTEANAILPGDPDYVTGMVSQPTILGIVDAEFMINQCSIYENSGFLPMSAGDTIHCPMLIEMHRTAGTSDFYRLVMGFNRGANNWPETQKVEITCNAADSGGCNDWFIDPIPNPDGSPGKTIAQLQYRITKGKGSITNEGDFRLAFHIHMTRP